MNLHRLLLARQAQDNPVRIGVLGCGKFASMFLAQAIRTPGLHVAIIADVNPEGARTNLARIGWPGERYAGADLGTALRSGATWIVDDVHAPFREGAIDLVVDATGDPAAGVRHVLLACEHGKPIIMVNVEADALAGPLLAERAREAGIVYSLAYGDQPALICDLVDWARSSGFDVVAAGRGHKWLPEFQFYTPDNVWDGYGLTPEEAIEGGLNPRMFTSFLDGSKPAIESTAVANATGLTPAPDGLGYPPTSIDGLPHVCRTRCEGGTLHHKGQVEVVSSLHRDGVPIDYDIRFGVFVVFEADTDYIARCFREYGLATDDSGRYASMYKRWHLIGLELGISVASVALRGEPTGAATGWRADTVAVAKRDLAAGELLDGEGGYTVSGQLMPAARSLQEGALPVGLTHRTRLVNAVERGHVVRWSDIAVDDSDPAVRLRLEMEKLYRPTVLRTAHT
ncbi:MAG: SAF domain-containing protein [bacterium]|nr:SAF domain-containing protein [bacterium]MDE0242364.1 SAF domain-containing protein [bacterium]MDE0418587.1 SAF domain-containing protein [bacterium]